jgi:uncharacterized membrane protein YgcG
MTSLSRRSLVGLLAIAAALTTSVACSSRVGEDVGAGAIEAPLTSVGPDGARYAFPAGASLTLVGPAPAVTSVTLPVDGPGATATFDLAAGDYAATLSSVTSLVRTASAGVPASVPATLTDPQPYAVTITPGHATQLTFHFSVAEFGTVTVSGGSGSGSGSGSGGSSGSGSSGGGAACVHSVCVTGAKLQASCSACATDVCAIDPYCCKTRWDSVCTAEVPTDCAAGTCP